MVGRSMPSMAKPITCGFQGGLGLVSEPCATRNGWSGWRTVVAVRADQRRWAPYANHRILRWKPSPGQRLGSWSPTPSCTQVIGRRSACRHRPDPGWFGTSLERISTEIRQPATHRRGWRVEEKLLPKGQERARRLPHSAKTPFRSERISGTGARVLRQLHRGRPGER